jgi:dihydropteroate synthase
VIPVIRALVRETGLPVSVDTMKAPVAAAAIEAGASIINDVAAFRHDPLLFRVARESGAGVVLMHMQGDPRTMQANPVYANVVEEVAVFLAERMSAALAEGIPADRIALDPGIGFGKTPEHNLRLLRELPALIRRTTALVRPVLLGPPPFLSGLSRKSVIGHVTGRPVGDRLAGSLAGAVMAWRAGARIIRVHDVKETCDALKIAYALAPDVPL